MQTQLYTTPDVFETLQAEWLELLSRAYTNHVFMTPQFLKAWWEALGFENGELCITIFRDDHEKLIGIAPLFQDKNGHLQFIGCTTVSDYADFIIDATVAEEVLSEIMKQDWKKLSLFSIPQNSPTLSFLSGVSAQRKWQHQQTQQDVCPTMTLPKNWEEYLASLPKKQRHEIKRKWQKLESEVPSQFVLVQDFKDIEEDVADFIGLHQHSSEEKKSFWDEKHVAFFQKFAVAAAEKNWLRLFFLEIEGKRVATMLGFEYTNQFFLYNSGFDAEKYRSLSVGNVLTSYTIKHAIEVGNTQYDFLRGDEEYKFRFGAVSQPIYDVTVTKSS